MRKKQTVLIILYLPTILIEKYFKQEKLSVQRYQLKFKVCGQKLTYLT